MARRPLLLYPSQVDGSDSAYPDGKAQNDIVEGDGNGSPLEQAWVNELWGFQQAALDEAGIAADGTPERVGASQYLRAIAAVARGTAKGVVGDAVADDAAAINAALFLAASTGLGWVFLPPGQYRITAPLVMPFDVSLIGVPQQTRVLIDHPSNATLAFLSGTWKSEAVVDGITFEAMQPNTDSMIVVDSGCSPKVHVRNCAANLVAADLRGRLLNNASTSAEFLFEDCRMRGVRADGSVFRGNGKLKIRGGTFTMAPDATYPMIEQEFNTNNELHISDVDFVHVPTSSGGDVAFVRAMAGSVLAGKNRFFIDDSASPPSPTYAFELIADTKWNTSGNEWPDSSTASANAYKVTFSSVDGRLLRGSSLQLFENVSLVNTGGTSVIPSGVRSASVFHTAGPTIQLPQPLHHGQEFDLLVFNSSGGPLGFSLSNYGLSATQLTTGINAGQTARFVAIEQASSSIPKWVQIGGWGQVAP